MWKCLHYMWNSNDNCSGRGNWGKSSSYYHVPANLSSIWQTGRKVNLKRRKLSLFFSQFFLVAVFLPTYLCSCMPISSRDNFFCLHLIWLPTTSCFYWLCWKGTKQRSILIDFCFDTFSHTHSKRAHVNTYVNSVALQGAVIPPLEKSDISTKIDEARVVG